MGKYQGDIRNGERKIAENLVLECKEKKKIIVNFKRV